MLKELMRQLEIAAYRRVLKRVQILTERQYLPTSNVEFERGYKYSLYWVESHLRDYIHELGG